MKFFEFPYVIITIFVIFIFIMGLIGLYFTIKSVKISKGTVGKGFSGIGKIESDFEKAGKMCKNSCLIYISLPLDSMKRLYPESKAMRMYERIKKILLNYFCFEDESGKISIYGVESFVAVNNFEADEIAAFIQKL